MKWDDSWIDWNGRFILALEPHLTFSIGLENSQWIERLKSLVNEGAILEAVAFSIRAETPSGPFDFVVSRISSNHCTSSTEHSSSSGCVGSRLGF